MLLAAFEPGKDMAIANFSLAIFCLFTVFLPLLLITRGDKTESNRKFVAAAINPWSQVVKEAELAQVDLSEITTSVELIPDSQLKQEVNNSDLVGSGEIISLEIDVANESDELSAQLTPTDEDLIAA